MRVLLKEIFCMEWEMGREIVLDENCSFSITAYVGPQDSEISESFTLTVCNTDFVCKVVKQSGVFNSMWNLVTNDPSKGSIDQYLTDVISKIEGKDWGDCVNRLRLIGQYEFDEYQA